MLVRVNISSELISLRSRARAPKEAGINRQKEKLNASIGLSPNIRAAKMVEPDREMAGIMANAWNIPIIMALL